MPQKNQNKSTKPAKKEPKKSTVKSKNAPKSKAVKRKNNIKTKDKEIKTKRKNKAAKTKPKNDKLKNKPKTKNAAKNKSKPKTTLKITKSKPKIEIEFKRKWTNKKLPRNLLEISGNVTEDELLFILQKRYETDNIYTLMGDVIVAINPFKRIDSKSLLNKYLAQAQKSQTKIEDYMKYEPHSYQTAAIAYDTLHKKKSNQSIIISGESGAGKTETTKLILQFLIHVNSSRAGGRAEEIANKLMQSNPILEAFGNAKTQRNNNSSRFGKWMNIIFDNSFNLSGANVTNYLLEKSRISYQANDERNYHAFYFLCSATKNSDLHLNGDCSQFSFLTMGGCTKVDTIDDKKEFGELYDALLEFKFSKKIIEDIWKILAGILHTGNIDFSKKSNSIEIAANLFAINVEEFEKHLKNKVILIRKQETITPLDIEGNHRAKNSICKNIYDQLFNYLVQKINKLLNTNEKNDALSIGVLDIFGFEIFDKNMFEQFCINYTNEKLQNVFQKYCWDREMRIYKEEDINMDHIKFEGNIANERTCDLIENSRNGIIRLIQDEVTLPKGNDQSLYIRICKQHQSHKSFQIPKKQKRKKDVNLQFQITHFAGLVTYNVNGFFEKNLDSLNICTKRMLISSGLSLMNKLYPKSEKTSSAKQKCIAVVFHKSLKHLIREINETQPYFIRCIKPNNKKSPQVWNQIKIHEQLKFGGIFAYLDLRKCGYDIQIKFETFIDVHYYALRTDEQRKEVWKIFKLAKKEKEERKKLSLLKNAMKKLKEFLLKLYDMQSFDVQIGKSKVFLKTAQFILLSFAANFWIRKLQKSWRILAKVRIEKYKIAHAQEIKKLAAEKKILDEEKKLERIEEEKKEFAEKVIRDRKEKRERLDEELNEIHLELQAEKEKLNHKLQLQMVKLDEKYLEKENRALTKIHFEEKRFDRKYERNKEKLRDQMSGDIQRFKKINREILHVTRKLHKKYDRYSSKMNVQISKLEVEKKKLRRIIAQKIIKIQKDKKEIKRLTSMMKKKKKDDGGEYKNVNRNMHSLLMEDEWQISCIGSITENGGCSFYISLDDKNIAFQGVLQRGDCISLLSLHGYNNEANGNLLSIKVRVIRTAAQKLKHQIGYVCMMSTSYFTVRRLNKCHN